MYGRRILLIESRGMAGDGGGIVTQWMRENNNICECGSDSEINGQGRLPADEKF